MDVVSFTIVRSLANAVRSRDITNRFAVPAPKLLRKRLEKDTLTLKGIYSTRAKLRNCDQ